jgi:hypothetical protein
MIVAWHEYVFSAGFTARRARPKGQESLAQGLPWVSQNKRFALKGAGNVHAIQSSGSEPIPAVPTGPFRAHSGGKINPG